MSEPLRHYFKELRLQQFRGLVALARWQTFSAAASALGLTRASVWQQVRALEQEMACTLLRTRGQRVELTDAGKKLVEMVAPLVAGFDSVKAAFSSTQDDLPQTLVIATAPTFLIYELRDPISRIHALYPKLHLTVLERNSPAAIELLEQGGADLAVVARPESAAASASLEYSSLTRYPFTLICPPGHDLLSRKRVTLRDLIRHPLILPSNVTYCRRHFDNVLSRAGLLEKTNVVLESNFPIMHFEYVSMGMGVGLTPLPPEARLQPRLRRSDIRLRPVADLFGEEPIYYARRKGQFETAHATKFRELVTAGRNGA
jgi:LysR family transcriptional regulator, cys regulon transcriptional activator